MDVFQASGLIGTCSTMVNIFLAIRRCFRARKKIARLVNAGISSLENIQKQLQGLAVFVQVQGIGMMQFCQTARNINDIGDGLRKTNVKLEGIGRIHSFFRATEIVADLQSICSKLSLLEMELRLLIPSVQTNAKGSVIMEVLAPLVGIAMESNPDDKELKDKRQLLNDARQAFGSMVLGSRMNKLVAGASSHPSTLNLIMGKMYYLGLNVELNYSRSAFYFESAILSGNNEAYYYLGCQYEEGLGKLQDFNKAFGLYLKGAEKRDPACMGSLAWCFQHGIGTEKNDDLCLKYYKSSCSGGYARSYESSGYCYYYGIGTAIDPVEAAKLYRMGSEAGDEHALVSYADCLLYGSGIERNERAAVGLFKIAANAGSIRAIRMLGDCYSRGRGVQKDLKAAFSLYCEAAKDGSLRALARLGWFLVNGWGVDGIKEQGVRFIRQAVEEGDIYALRVLAKMYRNGIGTEVDKRKALEIFHDLAMDGFWNSNLHLGEMYKNGEGTSISIDRSIQHFENCVKYNDERAHWNLANIYNDEQDYLNKNRAVYHYRLAADLGHTEAIEIVAGYFVRFTGPRKVSSTRAELAFGFLENMYNLYSRRRNNTQNILAPQEYQSGRTWNDRFPLSQEEFADLNLSSHPPSHLNTHTTHLKYRHFCDNLEKMSELKLNRRTALNLTPSKLASVLSAYLVSYDCEMMEEYSRAKKCLLKYLRENLISGAVLVKAEREIIRNIIDQIADILYEDSRAPSAVMRNSIHVLVSSFMKAMRGTG